MFALEDDITSNINTLSTRIDPLVLNSLGRHKIAHLTHAALNPIQNHRPEEQILATSVLFAVMVERFGGDPEELYLKGRKVLFASGDGDLKTDASLESLRDYAALRVKGRGS